MDKETSKTIITVVAIIAATIVLVTLRNAIGAVAIGGMDGAVQPNAVGNDAAPAPNVKVDVAALPDDDPSMSQGNPTVTVVEFSDFQCPFCKRFHEEVGKQLIDAYVKTGKVKFVYRDFPLSFHPNAQPAAEAAECADEQGKFWPFHDKLFANQASLSADNYKLWAKELGLDMPKFTNCVDTNKYAAEVQKDFADGQALGVTGTPTTFINGRMIVGAQPYANFKAAIDAELK